MAVRLTVKGKEYMLKLVAGEITTINFTNMSIGSGGYSETEVADGDIINLKNIIVTTSIHNTYTSAGDDSKSQLYVDATFQNDNVSEEFEIREVGVFALDEEGSEYLYSYDILSGDTGFAIMKSNIAPQYMPISLDTGLSDINQANITISNDLAIVNKEEFDRFKIDVDSKDKLTLNTAKEYTDNELNKLEIEVDSKDTMILKSAEEYANTKDTIILDSAKEYTDTSVSSKANSVHNHALTSSDISGVLPISKGGTGNTSCIANYVRTPSSTISNPYYLLGSSSSSNSVLATRIAANEFLRYPNYNRYINYLQNIKYIAPANGWIAALHRHDEIVSSLYINNRYVSVIHAPLWGAVRTSFHPVRAGDTFKLERSFGGQDDIIFYYNR